MNTRSLVGACLVVACLCVAPLLAQSSSPSDTPLPKQSEPDESCGCCCDSAYGECCDACDPVCGKGCGNYCCIDPVLTASVDWVFLQRGRLGNLPVFTTPGGANIFNASQFGFDFKSGIDANLRYRLNPCVAIEGRYLWVDGWQDTVGPFPLASGDRAGTTPPADVGDETDSVIYNSKFQSAEINLRRTSSGSLEMDILAGVRYVKFDEAFLNPYAETSSPVTGLWTQAANNSLIGFQLGADALIWDIRPGLRLDGTAKAGVYYNHARTFANIYDSTGTFNEAASDTQNHAAFLGELGLLLSYELNSAWSARLGYHLVWLDGVATAAAQIPNTSDWGQTGPFTTTTNVANNALLHGFSAGLERRF